MPPIAIQTALRLFTLTITRAVLRPVAALVLVLLTGCTGAIPSAAPTATFPLPPTEMIVQASPPTSEATLIATLTSTARPSRTPAPTRTKAPTSTITPTIPFIFPTDGLQTKGPYLVYPLQIDDPHAPWKTNTKLQVLDANAAGKMIFSLPNEGYLGSFWRAFSPSGQWIAYYTGSPQEAGPNEKYQFALRIYNWKTGEDKKITDLLSLDYPSGFEKTAQMLMNSGSNQIQDKNTLLENLRETFLGAAFTSTWSPDGRYLAFAGQMDGPSSDLYVYVLSTGEIRRLTDGPANIQWMIWTPDSQRIFHYSAYNLCQGECGKYHVAQLDGTTWTLKAVDNYGGVNIFAGWVSNKQIGVFSHANGPYGPLRYLNIETGEDVIIFDDSVYDAVYDPNNRQWLIADPYPHPKVNSKDEIKAGLYMVDPSAKASQWIDPHQCYQVNLLNFGTQQFLASCFDDKTIIISKDGVVTPLTLEDIGRVELFLPSPDKNMAVVAGRPTTGLVQTTLLVDTNNSIKYRFAGYPVKNITWKRDSTGFYFVSSRCSRAKNACLYYFSLAENQITLIDNQLGESESSGNYLRWVE